MSKLEKDNDKQAAGNSRVAVLCLSIVLGMGAMAYAAVPLYQIFCQVTGYGGTTQRVENSDGIKIVDRDIEVRFDANVDTNLAWDFKPLVREVNVKLGERKRIAYTATNLSDQPLTASATFNVTPQSTGVYFNKLECFCFTETTLQPGETKQMPVEFFVDPDLITADETKNIRSITLSYTFYQTGASDKSAEIMDINKPVNTSQEKL